jgi:Zn-dependent protease
MGFSLRVWWFSGIPVYLHWSLFLAVPLITLIIGMNLSLSSGFFAATLGVPIDSTIILTGISPYALGLMICLGIYASFFMYLVVTVRAARRRGIHATGMTLYIIGGSCSFAETINAFRDVLPIALAGPMVHLYLGILAWLAVYVAPYAIRVPPITGVAIIFFGYLAILNLAFFIFTLLPGLPMNGGRILQAWLGQRMPPDKAMRISATSGKIIAILFVLLGFLALSVVLILVGILIYLGAADERKRSPSA